MDRKELVLRIAAFISILAATCVFVLFFTACKATKPVVASENKTENRFAEVRETINDSVFVFRHDSVFVRERGDTVFVDRWRSLIQYRSKTDTVSVRDSVYINRDVVAIKEVNRITGLQNFQIWCGRILLGIVSLIGLYLILKRRLKW
jgi:hypothetical protein